MWATQRVGHTQAVHLASSLSRSAEAGAAGARSWRWIKEVQDPKDVARTAGRGALWGRGLVRDAPHARVVCGLTVNKQIKGACSMKFHMLATALRGWAATNGEKMKDHFTLAH